MRLHYKTGANPTTRAGYKEAMGKGANGSIRCCKDSPCHGDKGNRTTGWGICHVKPSRRERRGTALEGLTSMSKATEKWELMGGIFLEQKMG